ncbi:hypothetical protein MKW98_024780 [Papaver atlanticum]|uniref:Uncharacterized protein n=1 Tax=Papaver atlanticum TaxID=357466 RepID=A0AAD4XSG3_9MAGN|nr:hypothetical protein MKW98_024780 [Papaver atlanticum]
MELNNMASESASQSPSGLNNSAPGFVVPGLSLPDMGVGFDVCNSLALQQYQFDQLIVSRLTLTQQQADSLAERTKAAAERSAASAAEICSLLKDEKSNVLEVNYVEQQADALAISIKAAAERAAAHAADISRLLNDEKCDRCDAPEVKNVELKRKREQPERKPHSRAPSSPTSLKSKSISPLRPRHISPIKPRNSGREEYSRSDFRSRSHRKPSSHGRHDDQRNYTKSRHKRGVDRESHDRYTSSSRRRSPLARKRSSRHQHDDSRSPQRSRSRSRSPRPQHRKPSRVQNERRISKSLLNSNRIYSPRSSMRTAPRDDFSRRGLTPTLGTTSVLMEENKVDNNDFSRRSLSPNNKVDDDTLNLAVNSREVEDKPSSKSLKNRSSYTSRSHSTSDNSGKLSTHADMPGHPSVSGDSRTYPSPISPKFMNERKEDGYSPVMVLNGAEEIEEGELILSPKK